MFEILGLDFICKAWDPPVGTGTRLHHHLNGLSIVEADGSLVFLEANRDPSWVIDGGAKKVRRDTFPQNLLQQFARRCSELEWSMGTNLVLEQ